MDNLTELYCLVDNFCRVFEPLWEQHLLTTGKKQHCRAASLSLSELMTLAILFHQLRFRHFKTFYQEYGLCCTNSDDLRDSVK